MTTVSIEIDDQLLARLRELAAASNLSVAQIAQRLLAVRSSPSLSSDELGPLTRAASGIAPPMSDEQVEKLLDEERMRKFGGE